MNPSLGLCLRLSTQIPVPHLLVLVCWALGLGTSPPLAPGLLFLAPRQGRCLTKCIHYKIQ